MSLSFKTMMMLALGFSSIASAVEFKDFNQKWKLTAASKGECAPSIRVSYDEDFLYHGSAIIFDENFKTDGSFTQQHIVSIDGAIINGRRGTSEIEDSKLILSKFTKHWLSRNYSVLDQKHEFSLNFPSLSLKSYQNGKLEKNCSYELENPDFIKPITSCSLFAKGQEVTNSECVLEAISEDEVKCKTNVSVSVEDEAKNRTDRYYNFKITGPKVSTLNNSDYYIVSYLMEFGDDRYVLDKSRPIAPSITREFKIHTISQGEEDELTLRCK